MKDSSSDAKAIFVALSRPSGVEWLGDVPEGWVTVAGIHIFYMGRGRVISHEDYPDNPFRCRSCRLGAIGKEAFPIEVSRGSDTSGFLMRSAAFSTTWPSVPRIIPFAQALREGDWKPVRAKDGESELYNLG